MANGIRTFGLLLYKNLIIRKRHWATTVFVQCLVPVVFVVWLLTMRHFVVHSPLVIDENTYYPIETKEMLPPINRMFTFLYYVPQNSYTKSILEDVRMCLHLHHENILGFPTEDAMIDAYTMSQFNVSYVENLALVFEQYNTTNMKYKIRHSSKILSTLFQNMIDESTYNSYTMYVNAVPFVQLQICVDEALINHTASYTMMDSKVSIQRMPYPPYTKIDETDTVLRQVICLVVIMVFLVTLSVEIIYATKEKYIGVNVLMAMNGVELYQNLLSWLITGTLVSTFYVVPMIILFKSNFSGNVEPYLYYSNTFIFWLILTVHIAHLISFGMHVAAYFTKERFVITILSIVYVGVFSLYENLIRMEVSSMTLCLGILFPNILLYRFLEDVNTYESQLIGIQWSNIFDVRESQHNIIGSFGFIFIFSILGILLNFSLAVYINAILPGKYGIGKEPFYFFKYLKKNKVCLDEDIENLDYESIDNENFEPIEKDVLTPGIEIRNLKKTYKTTCLRKSAVQALKGISMDLYRGQITALLGHNGAGKTTLMSILTGVISATEGKVFINGKNIIKDLQFIRDDMGLCTQENIVFPDLSVYEQLELFGLLKRTHKTRKEIQQDINVLLDKLKLLEKRNVLPKKLSGGQKRRLCLGMALIGNASTIILDEPTSGVDPETRRDIWNIILKIRGKKTILISTHNMEEADILGDRIAIVHGGRLKCYGTSMFLKKQYGYGHITVTLSTKSWRNAEEVINKFDPRTQQISVDSEKIVLNVPSTETLPQSLDKVESQKKNLGVTGISVSLITLEEVFLKVIKGEDNGKHLNELFYPLSQKVEGWDLRIQEILALYRKKLSYTKKNWLNILMTLFYPVLMVIIVGLNYSRPSDSTDVFPLELNIYKYPKALYSSTNESIGTEYKNLITYFGGSAKETKQNESVTKALLDQAIQDIAEYRNNYIVSAEFNISDGILYANGFYSEIAIHSIPLTMNLLSNALIKSIAGDEYSIHVSVQKLPDVLSLSSLTMPQIEPWITALQFCCFFSFAISLFVIHPFQERKTKLKQLQRMTGVTSVSYWLTIFTFDLLVLIVTILVTVLEFYFMDLILDTRMYYKIEILTIILLLFLFGVNSLFITYIFSFMNKSQNAIITISSLAPTVLVTLQYILHQVFQSTEKLKILYSIQKSLFPLVPHVSFLHGQISFFNVATQNARCRQLSNRLLDAICLHQRNICCDLDCVDGVCKNQLPYFSDQDSDMSLTKCVIYLSLTPLIYFSILIMLEERLPQKLYAKISNKNLKDACEIKDDQVNKEKHAVALEIRKLQNRGIAKKVIGEPTKAVPTIENDFLENVENNDDSLFLVYELSKCYGKLTAVEEISFRVKQRECFGLLGVNGAGKSTTFRMLTGEEIPNSGTMYLGKSEIHTDRKNYLAQMGYCPQTDALLNSLNSFDHLRLFALLRGIPRSKVDLEVNKWINRLNLNACMHQPSGTYSGGNKRRLNIAMALIGNPNLVLLDEPTTGVDPAARRSLWNILQSCQAMGQSLILTSHSMEECEALCNRLVIMVKGQLVCIGASQELKQRFGAGYDIHIKLNLNRADDDASNIKRIMESSLSCEIRDENLGLIAYHVSDIGTTWEKMYNIVNDLKRQYSCIEDYAVLSATLEQIFIQFARGTESMKSETSVVDSTTQTIDV